MVGRMRSIGVPAICLLAGALAVLGYEKFEFMSHNRSDANALPKTPHVTKNEPQPSQPTSRDFEGTCRGFPELHQVGVLKAPQEEIEKIVDGKGYPVCKLVPGSDAEKRVQKTCSSGSPCEVSGKLRAQGYDVFLEQVGTLKSWAAWKGTCYGKVSHEGDGSFSAGEANADIEMPDKSRLTVYCAFDSESVAKKILAECPNGSICEIRARFEEQPVIPISKSRETWAYIGYVDSVVLKVSASKDESNSDTQINSTGASEATTNPCLTAREVLINSVSDSKRKMLDLIGRSTPKRNLVAEQDQENSRQQKEQQYQQQMAQLKKMINQATNAVQKWQLENRLGFLQQEYEAFHGRPSTAVPQASPSNASKMQDTIKAYEGLYGAWSKSLTDITVINVRQTNFDQTNNVYYCSGEFSGTAELPQLILATRRVPTNELESAMIVSQIVNGAALTGEVPTQEYILSMMPPLDTTRIFKNVCVGSFDYKVESILDKPGQQYVSWRCNQTVYDSQ